MQSAKQMFLIKAEEMKWWSEAQRAAVFCPVIKAFFKNWN